jgi:rRNA maturation endonuclease Nob1
MPTSGKVWTWLSDNDVIYECRECRATLDADDRMCSSCGSTAIVMYDLS